MAMAGATILNVQVINPATTVLGKRTRENEITMDLSKPLPYPAPEEVVEAMRQRILMLETELHIMKKRKTAATSQQNAVAGPSNSAPPTAATSNPKADAKTIKTRTKSLFDQLKKAAKSEKYTGVVRTVRIEDHFTQGDFELVFGSSGTLVQPTPTNKPKSNVWIRQYYHESDYADFFGEAYKIDQLKGTKWSVGNIFAGKGQKLGQVQLEIQSMEVQWSKNTGKITLKAEVCEFGGPEAVDQRLMLW